MQKDRNCFVSEKKDAEVREYFEKRRGRLLGSKDEVKGIEKRYAPVAFFEMMWEEETDTGFISKTKKTCEKSNVFYVNLNTAELYYVGKSLRGKPGIKRTDFLEKMIDLPPMAIEFLSDIARKGSIRHHELNKKHFLFLDGNFDLIMMLKTRDLISFNATAYNVKDSRVYSIREYFSKISMLNTDDRRYDLRVFLSTEKKRLDEGLMDEVVYNVDEVMNILEAFLQGKCKSKNTVYMPYHRCRYADREGRFRFEELISPKFSAAP